MQVKITHHGHTVEIRRDYWPDQNFELWYGYIDDAHVPVQAPGFGYLNAFVRSDENRNEALEFLLWKLCRMIDEAHDQD